MLPVDNVCMFYQHLIMLFSGITLLGSMQNGCNRYIIMNKIQTFCTKFYNYYLLTVNIYWGLFYVFPKFPYCCTMYNSDCFFCNIISAKTLIFVLLILISWQNTAFLITCPFIYADVSTEDKQLTCPHFPQIKQCLSQQKVIYKITALICINFSELVS